MRVVCYKEIQNEMTWVVGRAGPFGHAVGLSDIRVTLHDGSEHDCLQKMYKIGPQLVLGFAGSVAIGLELVAQLGTVLKPKDKTGSWDPQYIAERLQIGTRELFNLFPEHQRLLGCELMLLSAHPTENDGAAPWARCYVHRFCSPKFESLEAAQAQIVSIGSGSDVKPYAEVLDALSVDVEMFKLEMGFPGGSGLGLMSSLTSLLLQNPTAGISRHLHICIVGRDSVRIGTNNPFTSSHKPTDEAMPNVARSMEELNQILGDVSSSMLALAVC